MSGPDASGEPAPSRGGAYTYTGSVRWEYSPQLDRDPDPGEIVWSWVAYEEDASIGKDRPIAVVGRAVDDRLVALMLSSQDHRGDRGWISIGTGPWDRQGRESFVRRDRFLVVHSDAVRREGAVLPRATYDLIAAGLGGRAATRAAAGRPKRQRGLLTALRRLFGRTPS